MIFKIYTPLAPAANFSVYWRTKKTHRDNDYTFSLFSEIESDI